MRANGRVIAVRRPTESRTETGLIYSDTANDRTLYRHSTFKGHLNRTRGVLPTCSLRDALLNTRPNHAIVFRAAFHRKSRQGYYFQKRTVSQRLCCHRPAACPFRQATSPRFRIGKSARLELGGVVALPRLRLVAEHEAPLATSSGRRPCGDPSR